VEQTGASNKKICQASDLLAEVICPMMVKSLVLKYTPETLLDLFAPLAHQRWAMLLTSGQADHADNRFDILTADPRATLTTRGASTEIICGDDVIHSAADPLLLVHVGGGAQYEVGHGTVALGHSLATAARDLAETVQRAG